MPWATVALAGACVALALHARGPRRAETAETVRPPSARMRAAFRPGARVEPARAPQELLGPLQGGVAADPEHARALPPEVAEPVTSVPLDAAPMVGAE